MLGHGRRTAALLAVAGVIVVAGCGSDGSEPGGRPASSDANASLEELAVQEGQLSWYSAMPVESAQALSDAFEAAYPGISVTAERVVGSTVYERFVQEQRAGQHNVDVIQGSGYLEFEDVHDLGLLLDYKPPTYDRIPEDFRIGDYAYACYSVDTAAIVNTEKVSDDEAALLRTWSGIVDPRWKGRMATVEPYTGGARYSALMYVMGEPELGEEWLRAFGDLEPGIFSDLNQAAEAVAKGEYDVMFPYFEGGAFLLMEGGAPVTWQFQDPTISFGSTNSAIAKEAPHPNAAKLFQNWLLNEDGAEAMLKLGLKPALQGVEDTREFVAAPWYQAPSENTWAPDFGIYEERFDKDVAAWDREIKK